MVFQRLQSIPEFSGKVDIVGEFYMHSKIYGLLINDQTRAGIVRGFASCQVLLWLTEEDKYIYMGNSC